MLPLLFVKKELSALAKRLLVIIYNQLKQIPDMQRDNGVLLFPKRQSTFTEDVLFFMGTEIYYKDSIQKINIYFAILDTQHIPIGHMNENGEHA